MGFFYVLFSIDFGDGYCRNEGVDLEELKGKELGCKM